MTTKTATRRGCSTVPVTREVEVPVLVQVDRHHAEAQEDEDLAAEWATG